MELAGAEAARLWRRRGRTAERLRQYRPGAVLGLRRALPGAHPDDIVAQRGDLHRLVSTMGTDPVGEPLQIGAVRYLCCRSDGHHGQKGNAQGHAAKTAGGSCWDEPRTTRGKEMRHKISLGPGRCG